MLKEVKTCFMDELNETPTLDDIKACVAIAKENDCIVKLEWTMKWSGHYARYIRASDDPQEFYDNKLPKVYGL
jgi:hypothetical protein